MDFFTITLLASVGVIGLLEFIKANFKAAPAWLYTVVSAGGCLGVSIALGLTLQGDLNPFGSQIAYIVVMFGVQMFIHELGYQIIVKGFLGLLNAVVAKLGQGK